MSFLIESFESLSVGEKRIKRTPFPSPEDVLDTAIHDKIHDVTLSVYTDMMGTYIDETKLLKLVDDEGNTVDDPQLHDGDMQWSVDYSLLTDEILEKIPVLDKDNEFVGSSYPGFPLAVGSCSSMFAVLEHERRSSGLKRGCFIDIGSGEGNVLATSVASNVFTCALGIEMATSMERRVSDSSARTFTLAEKANENLRRVNDLKDKNAVYTLHAQFDSALMHKICERLDPTRMNVAFVFATGMDDAMMEEIVNGLKSAPNAAALHCLVVSDYEDTNVTFSDSIRSMMVDAKFKREVTEEKQMIQFSPLVQSFEAKDANYVTGGDFEKKKKIIFEQAEFFAKEFNVAGDKYQGVRTDYYRNKLTKKGKSLKKYGAEYLNHTLGFLEK